MVCLFQDANPTDMLHRVPQQGIPISQNNPLGAHVEDGIKYLIPAKAILLRAKAELGMLETNRLDACDEI